MHVKKSRTRSEKPESDYPGQPKHPKWQTQMRQSLPYRPSNYPCQGRYSPDGNEDGGQIRQGREHKYHEPPPPYQFSEDGRQGVGMQPTRSDSKKPAISTAGWAKNDSLHHTNPFNPGSMGFPPVPAHSVRDGFGDSGRSEISEHTGMGPVSRTRAHHGHKSRRQPKGAPGYLSSTHDHGRIRVAPSVSDSVNDSDDDKYSEADSTDSASTLRGPTPTSDEKTGARSESFSAMLGSAYESDGTLRGVPNTGVPDPSQKGGYERSRGNYNMSVAGSDIGSASEFGSDTSSVGFTEIYDDKLIADAYWRGYWIGYGHSSKVWEEARQDAQVYAAQLQSGAYGGEKHGRWSTAVYNQLNSGG